MLLAHASSEAGAAGGSALASWTPLTVLLVLFGAAVVALLATQRGPLLARIPVGLERLTRIPGWAAATVGLSLYGLLVAGVGFYSDVAWHIALGRDEVLFTAPHTAILLGLGCIAASGFVAIVAATVTDAAVGLRVGGMRVPWSALPLLALGLGAVLGFPLDELWHAEYGIDVTMWSPTHMLMILGASFSGMASWLVIGEAGVPSDGNRWQRAAHYVAAWLTLQGLVSSQGEFSFGVPQFQQLYHPLLVTLAAAFALVAFRLVLGWKATLAVTLVTFLLELTGGPSGNDGPVETRAGGIYLGSALVVVVVAALLGTQRRVRFAAVAGLGAGTLGLAVEFAWNAGAFQPWRASLLPDALLLCAVAGTAAGVLGAAFGAAVRARDVGAVPGPVLALAGLVVLASLLVPGPRRVGDVRADIRLDRVDETHAVVEVTLDPPDAADDARWFQTVTWQGGALELAEMERVGEGRYRADKPVTIAGNGKTMVRLHRDDELMTVPVRFPADPEIGEPAIPAEDRVAAFGDETQFLMRESRGGDAWLAWAVGGLLLVVGLTWIAAFVVAARAIGRRPEGGIGDHIPGERTAHAR